MHPSWACVDRASSEEGAAKDERIEGLAAEGKKLAEQVGRMQKMVREKNAKIEEAEKENKRLANERDALATSGQFVYQTIRPLVNESISPMSPLV